MSYTNAPEVDLARIVTTASGILLNLSLRRAGALTRGSPMSRRPAQPHDAGRTSRATGTDPLEIISLSFGLFPEITALNDRFLPRQRRLKLTLDVNLDARAEGRTPASFMEGLDRICPSLSRHLCCGDNRIQETFFRAGRRPSCAMREADDAVDIAHLLEHLVIDFQHFIADMRVCSGVTCCHRSPVHRCDVFIESPDERVSRLSVTLACNLMNGLLTGAPADPSCARIVRLARHVYRSPGAALTPCSAKAALDGDEQYLSVLLSLTELGFIREVETSMNFSGMPLYSLSAIDPGGS